MAQYQDDIKAVAGLKETHGSAWNAINPEYAARMRAQNKFKTGLDIAKYTAKIMRADMAAYDAGAAGAQASADGRAVAVEGAL